ncbi:MAG: PIG-L family deacetylase, partial [Abitibacteriaceae bacterium]|nr:PIG-L family deacetylase [Abditibacteriaceae bacterium]
FPLAPTFTSQDRLLVLSPHCDDETLGVGGTLAAARSAGAAVRVVFLTNGDGSRSTQLGEGVKHPSNLLHRRNSLQQLAYMRQRETIAALGELGVAPSDVIFLGYPDGGTKEMWENYWSPRKLYRSNYTGVKRSPYTNSRTPQAAYCGSQALKDVTDAIAEWQPTVVFTTHPNDTHPDHWAAYAYSRAALEMLRLRPATRTWAGQTQLLTFLVHRGWWPAPHGYHPDAHLAPPSFLKDTGTHWAQSPLDEPSRTAKQAALERYVSQLTFTPQYLRGFLRRDELFGTVPVNALASHPVAPAQAATNGHHKNGHHKTSASPILLVQDPTHDSLLHDVWAAADLQSITAIPHTLTDGLTLQIGLAKPVSPRLTYRLCLHALTGDAVQNRIVNVQWRNNNWQATLDNMPGQLPLQLTASGFDLALPRAILKFPAGAYTLLVSASTHLGSTCIDQTETGTLRLAAPTIEVHKPLAIHAQSLLHVFTG